MKKLIFSLFLFFIMSQNLLAQREQPVEVMILGFDHFNQLDDGTPQSNIFSVKKQQEILQVIQRLQEFAPDQVLVEAEPNRQNELDSLFQLYSTNALRLKELENGSSETYQVAFRLAKLLNHPQVYAVDHYEAISQGLLNNGENIALFREELKKLQQTARPMKKLVQQDSLSIYDYLVFMNRPETVRLTHNLFYNLPAYVTNGSFSETGTNTAGSENVDEEFIGAEYISLFYKRNLKIYSNILKAQRKGGGKKLLILMGQTHVGVLQDLIEDNAQFKVISPLDFLN